MNPLPGALTTVLALTFVLTVVWYAWDWASGGRRERRRQRINNGEMQ